MRTLVLLSSLAVISCHPAARERPSSDAGPPVRMSAVEHPENEACGSLARLGCIEATSPGYCRARMRADLALGRVSEEDLACAKVATSKVAVRACSSLCTEVSR